MAKTYTQQEVAKFFQDRGAELVSTYMGAHASLEFKCAQCGNVQRTTFADHKSAPEKGWGLCKDCRKEIARQNRKLDFGRIKAEFESKGALVPDQQYIANNVPIKFFCSQCGAPAEITWGHYICGRNPELKCMKCNNRARPTLEQIRALMDAKGARLLSTKYIRHTTSLEFECSSCGKRHSITWGGIQIGNNPNFLCPVCMSNAKPTIEQIRREFAAVGAELVSTTYQNNHTPIYFRCSSCGELHSVPWNNWKKSNPLLLCPECGSSNFADSPTQEDIRQAFLQRGAEFKGTEYKNNHTLLEFVCTKCGETGRIDWAHFKAGQNKRMLCKACLKGPMYNPGGNHGAWRLLADTKVQSMCTKFFNIAGDYAAHHIKQFARFPEYRTSIPNLYPVLREYHANSFEYAGVTNPLHTDPRFQDVRNFPEFLRLPYHTYEGFEFLDLNSVVSEIIFPFDQEEKYTGRTDATQSTSLLNAKVKFAREGKLYLPFYFSELVLKPELVMSMVRSRLYHSFPDIYRYTGQAFRKFYARKLIVRRLTGEEAREFFSRTHIQGFLPAKVYVGLVDGDAIIQAASFGTSRFDKNHEWELLRFSTDLNTQVVGGFAKLFTQFKREFGPQSVVAFCDLRFSETDPTKTVYGRNGFELVARTAPSYKYIRKDSLRMYSRIAFQKHKLQDLLDIFDETKSEAENMTANGYVRQYDCGNLKFIWTNQQTKEE